MITVLRTFQSMPKKTRQAEASSPNSSSAREISRGFAESFSPENCFRKTESALLCHLSEYLEDRSIADSPAVLLQRAEHTRKTDFSFLKEKLGRAQIRNAKTVFLGCRPDSSGQRRGWLPLFRVFGEIHSNFV